MQEQIRIPTEDECWRLIARMGMLENIVAHSRQVCRVSLLIAESLSSDGLDRDLIGAAALLHDITKTRSFTTQEDHAETGERLLSELGFPEVGKVVGQHVRLDRYFAGPGSDGSGDRQLRRQKGPPRQDRPPGRPHGLHLGAVRPRGGAQAVDSPALGEDRGAGGAAFRPTPPSPRARSKDCCRKADVAAVGSAGIHSCASVSFDGPGSAAAAGRPRFCNLRIWPMQEIISSSWWVT